MRISGLLLPLLSSSLLSLTASQTLVSCADECHDNESAVLCLRSEESCLCTDEWVEQVYTCVEANCGVKEALADRNATANMCGMPVRDRRGIYNVASTTLVSLAVACVAVRVIYKSFFYEFGLTPDDWLVLTMIIVDIPAGILNVKGMTGNGFGLDIWTVPPDAITEFMRAFYVMGLLYFVQITLFKTSIQYFYLQIFPTKEVRVLLNRTIIFNIAVGIIFITVDLFQCQPVGYYWHSWEGIYEGECINLNALVWVHAGVSIAIDVWMLAIPLSQLPGLQMSWKRKAAVALMFFVGTLLSSILTFANSTNLTYDQVDVANWSTIEINVGIICACMPSLRLTFIRLGKLLELELKEH